LTGLGSPGEPGNSNGAREKWLEIKVTDTGVGIPSEAISRIFDKFSQADSSATRSYEGMGLGLYIVKQFTELLGGCIEAESAIGKGSTFTVALPVMLQVPSGSAIVS
jgi:signal transduction histidine kinase